MPIVTDLINKRDLVTNEDVINAIQLALSFRFDSTTLTLHVREREKKKELIRPDNQGNYTLKRNGEYLITGVALFPDQNNQDLSIVSLTDRKRSIVAFGDSEIEQICLEIRDQFENMPFHLMILQPKIAVHIVMLNRAVADEKFLDRSLISENKPEETFTFIVNRNSLKAATSEIQLDIKECMSDGRGNMMMISSYAAEARRIFDSFIVLQDDRKLKSECKVLREAVKNMLKISKEEENKCRAAQKKLGEFTQAVICIKSSSDAEVKEFQERSEQTNKEWEKTRKEEKALFKSLAREMKKVHRDLKKKDKAVAKSNASGLFARIVALTRKKSPQKGLQMATEKLERRKKIYEEKILEKHKKFEESSNLEKLLKSFLSKKNDLEGFAGIVVTMNASLESLARDWHNQCHYFCLLQNLITIMETQANFVIEKQSEGLDKNTYRCNLLTMAGSCRAVMAAVTVNHKVYDQFTQPILSGDVQAISTIRDGKERLKVEEMIQEEKKSLLEAAIKDVRELAEKMSTSQDQEENN